MRVEYPALIVGGYGYRNVGDEAMLAGLLDTVDRTRVTVVSRSPAETAALHDVRSIPIAHAVPALRTHRTLVLGGGALFSADMGVLGRLLPLYGLFAHSLGRRVLIEGVSFDDGSPGRRTRATKRLVAGADHVRVRDQRSVDLLAEWGIAAQLAPDLSATLPASSARLGADLLRRAGVASGRPVVGLCLTAVNRELVDRLPGVVARVVDARPDLEFCFIPMSQHPFVPAHNDLLLAQRLQRVAPRLRIIEGVHRPADVLAVFGRLAAVVGMRYHSLVFAERAGAPLVAIAYAPKCHAWLAEREMSSVDLSSGAIVEALGTVVAQERIA